VTRTILVAAVLVFACRGNDATPVDSPTGTGGSDAMGSGSGSSDACTTYTKTSIAAMRQATKTGCFEFDGVVSLGVSSSTTNPKLWVEDSAGGAYSAIMGECESKSTTHPCAVASTVSAAVAGHTLTVQGTYIKTESTTFEEFYIQNVTDPGTPGTVVPAATAELADIERSGSNTALRFQYVTVAAGTLKMYDWTPAEFDDTTATSCPYVTGFGMIPMSVSVTEGAACAGSAAQPAGQSPPNTQEVLVGTDFYKSFLPETDCKCATGSDVPEASSTVTGTIKGMLMFDVPFNGTTGYYYLDPTSPTDFPITPVAAVP
jgi:hypothetical protein